MSMRSKQAGVTLIGWIILLIPVVICGYSAMRLAPVYLNYMKVSKTLEQLKTEIKSTDAGNATVIRNTIQRHFDIESVSYPESKDIKVTRDGRNWVVSAAYDDQAPLFANMFILVAFDKSVTLGGGASD
jgi:hypothetical protein